MRKKLDGVLAVASACKGPLLACLCLTVSLVQAAEPMVSDDFESYVSGSVNGLGMWTVGNGSDANDAVVEEGINSAFSEGSRALRFFRQEPAEKSHYLMVQVEETGGDDPLVVTWDWMPATYAAGAQNPMFTLYDGSVPAVQFAIHHTTNMLRFYEEEGAEKDGDSLPQGAFVFDSQTWYRFRLVVKPASSTYDLRVWKDGGAEPVVDVSGIRFANPVSGITSLRFSANVPSDSVFPQGYYFDNVVVQSGHE